MVRKEQRKASGRYAMDAAERRKKIQERLSDSTMPISASALAGELGVSRQIIVGDVALLRASGKNILSTPRGYILPAAGTSRKVTRRIACRHDSKAMKDELYCLVDQGCTVIDVIVEHPVYGEITGSLHLASRSDVDLFIEKCSESSAVPLSFLTEGVHLHTIEADDEAAIDRAMKKLQKMGILIEN
jgi:transcriptional regulator of NAD metabolism